MQFTLIITDNEDNKSVSVEMKRTDKAEESDPAVSNAAAMMAAILNMLDTVDDKAVEEATKIQLQ